MKLNELKSGMKIILRNNDLMYVLIELGAFYDSFGNRCANYTYYTNDLKSRVNKKYDMVKIYEGKELLWERKEIPELTGKEVTILNNVDKKFKYIARDLYENSIGIFEAIPHLDDDKWRTNDSAHEAEFPFSNIFKSITFENSPILISDLLKGEQI